MTAVELRPLAQADIVEAGAYYLAAGGPNLAEEFLRSTLMSWAEVRRMPGIGSTAFAERCGVDGLRAWRTKGFPYQCWYVVRDDVVDVVRVLADRRDIPALIADAPEE